MVVVETANDYLRRMSRKTGIKFETLSSRYYKGLRDKELVEPVPERNGINAYLLQLSKTSGIKYSTLTTRYHNEGWRGAKLVKAVPKHGKKTIKLYCGKSFREWAELISKKTGLVVNSRHIKYYYDKFRYQDIERTNKEILILIGRHYGVEA